MNPASSTASPRVARPNLDTSRYIPAPDVVSELLKSPLPPEAKAFLTAASVETLLPGPIAGPLYWPYSWSVFRCEFGFRQWPGSMATFPPWGGDPAHDTHAFGPWQDEPLTYADAAAKTGRPSVEPQDQIANNWVIAVSAAAAHGIDLLATLRAGQLDAISPALYQTWPEGCDGNFPARYTQALALFTNPVPPPAPPPPPMPNPNPPIVLRLGQEETFPVKGEDQNDKPYLPPLPPDAIVSDDTGVCTVLIQDGIATVLSAGVGQTLIHGPGFAKAVTVLPVQQLTRIVADWSKAVIRDIPNAMLAGAILALAMLGPPSSPQPGEGAVANAALPAPAPPADATSDPHAADPRPITEASRQTPIINKFREPAVIGDPDFCFRAARTSLIAMERCLAWTRSLSRR